jgi:hypothetical protein
MSERVLIEPDVPPTPEHARIYRRIMEARSDYEVDALLDFLGDLNKLHADIKDMGVVAVFGLLDQTGFVDANEPEAKA